MNNQVRGRTLFCMFGECENLALFGNYCKDHQLQRAEAAEARCAAKSSLIDEIIVTWEPMVERLLTAEARAAQLEAERDAFAAENDAIHRAVNEMCGTNTSTIEAVKQVIDERDELLRHNDNLIKEVAQWRIHVEHTESERDEARKWARLWKLQAKYTRLDAVITFNETH